MRPRFLRIPKKAGAWFARHRRTIGKALLMFALLVVAVLPAIVDNTVIGYLPVLLWAVVVIGMLAYFFVLKHGISFEERSDEGTCRRGEAAEVKVDIENSSLLLAPWLEAKLYISNLTGGVDALTTETFTLMPREERQLSLRARFDHIGTYQVGLYSLALCDLLGLYAHEYRAENLHEVEVAPRIVDLQHFDITERQTSDITQYRRAIVSDGYDYVGMRDYELGDPMKSIHWKASARFDEFMTRLYERQINPSICIVIDRTTRWPEGERAMAMYDAVIESALSIAAYARRNGIEYTVVIPDETGQPIAFSSGSTWDYKDVMHVLPRLEEDTGLEGVAEVVGTLSRGLYTSSNIVVCSSGPTERMLSELIQAHARQKSVALLFACPDDLLRKEDDALLRMLSRLSAGRVPYVRFSSVEKLEGRG